MNDISSLGQSLLHLPFSKAENLSLTSIRQSYANLDYPDLIFTLLFIINLIIIICYGLFVGIRVVSMIDDLSYVTVSSNNSLSTSSEHSSDFLGGVFMSLGLGITLSMSLAAVFAKLSPHLINTTIILSGAFAVLTGIVMFTMGYQVVGILLLFLSVFCSLFYLYMKAYIKFASVLLKIACQALEQLPSLYLVAAVVLLFQAFFSLMWLFAAIGTATNESKSYISANGSKYPLEDCLSYSYSTVSLSHLTQPVILPAPITRL
jgi:hypothetical protein